MSKRNNNLLEYCHGCLAKDRPLVSIDSLFHTFLKLMENKIDKIRIKANVPRMCWECRAALRNSEKFVLKAIKAQEFLAKYPARKVAIESLSNLSTVLIDYYDTQETHEDYVAEIKLESNDHFSQIDVDLKEENTSNDENFADDHEDIKEDIKEDLKVEIDIKSEPELTNEDNKLDIKVERKKGKKSMKTKFKIITLADDDFDFSKAHKKVMIDDKERMYWSEKDRSAKNYRTMAYKCELCITGHATKRHYDKHMAAFHSESSGKFECDICKRRYKSKRTLREDIREHYMKYACLLCDYEHRRPWKLKSHLKTHKRVFMCVKCGLKFGFLHTFYEHYRRLHKRVICDYCGKRWSNKQFLIKHIKQRHDEPRCEICNRTYASFESLTSHNRLHHEVVRTEESYCVECDVQFDNVARYMVHVKTSVKHKKYPGVPCPVCNKVYHKKYSMTNHYRHEHLKKTPYYCEECSRYFLHSYRLRIHKEKIHDKIQAPKDKMCPHCDRGFSTNRVLVNHIRTHTGERPFECDVCSSKFTQKSALTVHRRAVHKIK